MQKLAQAWLQNKFNLPMELYVAAFEADPNLEDQDGSRFGLTWRLGRNCLLPNITSFSGPRLFLDFF